MAKPKKIRVAITGNIGSGKSTFAECISDLGFPVLYADEISKEILSNDPEVKLEIVKNFGAQSYTETKINNKHLAALIFSNPEKLKKMNSILHPRVRKRIDEIAKEYFSHKDIVFVEAALIYESKIEKFYDYIVLIVSDYNIRLNRSIDSRKITKQEFIDRDKTQIRQELKQKKADFVFSNNGSIKELADKAKLLITLLESIT